MVVDSRDLARGRLGGRSIRIENTSICRSDDVPERSTNGAGVRLTKCHSCCSIFPHRCRRCINRHAALLPFNNHEIIALLRPKTNGMQAWAAGRMTDFRHEHHARRGSSAGRSRALKGRASVEGLLEPLHRRCELRASRLQVTCGRFSTMRGSAVSKRLSEPGSPEVVVDTFMDRARRFITSPPAMDSGGGRNQSFLFVKPPGAARRAAVARGAPGESNHVIQSGWPCKPIMMI